MPPCRPAYLLSTLLALGCGSATDPAAALRVTATPDRAVLAPGDTVSVAVEAMNASGADMLVPGGGPFTFLEVRDDRGRVVEFARRGVFPSIAYMPRALGPGERLADRPRWAGELADPAGATAAPGVYRIRAAIRLPGKGAGVAYSNTVEVRIAAP